MATFAFWVSRSIDPAEKNRDSTFILVAITINSTEVNLDDFFLTFGQIFFRSPHHAIDSNDNRLYFSFVKGICNENEAKLVNFKCLSVNIHFFYLKPTHFPEFFFLCFPFRTKLIKWFISFDFSFDPDSKEQEKKFFDFVTELSLCTESIRTHQKLVHIWFQCYICREKMHFA